MTEGWGDGAVQQPPAVQDGTTAGWLLRQAREAAGLHVAALAVSLKVPVRKLEALEENRWDLLPDLVFVRALASSVCRTLKVDPQPVLERLPQVATPRLMRASDGINTPFRAPSDGAPPTWVDQMTKPVYLAVFALLLGALVLILLPRAQQDEPVTAVIPAAPVEPLPIVIPPETPAPAPVALAASLPAATASAADVHPALPASAPAIAAAESAVAASGIVVFRVRGASWVEVTDAKGGVPVRKELQPGESAAASGPLPLQVTVGRVDQTQVQVRGKPFDMAPVSKDNVARFTIR